MLRPTPNALFLLEFSMQLKARTLLCALTVRCLACLSIIVIQIERLPMKSHYAKSLFTAILFVLCPHAFAGQIAITIDDAPFPDSAYYSRNERTRIIADKLSKSNVQQAMFFAVGVAA